MTINYYNYANTLIRAIEEHKPKELLQLHITKVYFSTPNINEPDTKVSIAGYANMYSATQGKMTNDIDAESPCYDFDTTIIVCPAQHGFITHRLLTTHVSKGIQKGQRTLARELVLSSINYALQGVTVWTTMTRSAQ